jgi:hypothetical protein
MKISEAKYQHISEYTDHKVLTFVFREWKVIAGEQKVPESDVRDVDGRIIGFSWHDYLARMAIRKSRSVRKRDMCQSIKIGLRSEGAKSELRRMLDSKKVYWDDRS